MRKKRKIDISLLPFSNGGEQMKQGVSTCTDDTLTQKYTNKYQLAPSTARVSAPTVDDLGHDLRLLLQRSARHPAIFVAPPHLRDHVDQLAETASVLLWLQLVEAFGNIALKGPEQAAVEDDRSWE